MREVDTFRGVTEDWLDIVTRLTLRSNAPDHEKSPALQIAPRPGILFTSFCGYGLADVALVITQLLRLP